MRMILLFGVFLIGIDFSVFGSQEKYNLTAVNVTKPSFNEISLFENFAALKNGDQAYHYVKSLLAKNETIGRRLQFIVNQVSCSFDTKWMARCR